MDAPYTTSTSTRETFAVILVGMKRNERNTTSLVVPVFFRSFPLLTLNSINVVQTGWILGSRILNRSVEFIWKKAHTLRPTKRSLQIMQGAQMMLIEEREREKRKKRSEPLFHRMKIDIMVCGSCLGLSGLHVRLLTHTQTLIPRGKNPCAAGVLRAQILSIFGSYRYA